MNAKHKKKKRIFDFEKMNEKEIWRVFCLNPERKDEIIQALKKQRIQTQENIRHNITVDSNKILDYEGKHAFIDLKEVYEIKIF